MISYFDTSALIPLLVEEAGSQRAELLWNESERVVGTRLAYAEARAALALAKRIDRITASSLRAAVNGLEHLYAGMSIVEISEDIVHRAGTLAESYALRGYDAVHLAAAETLADEDVVLVAGDERLCAAAASLGLAVGHT